MSYEDLDREGLLLPEDEWTDGRPRSMVSLWIYGGLGAVAVAGIALMVAGGGDWLTWLGAGVFAAFVIAFALVSLVEVDRRSSS